MYKQTYQHEFHRGFWRTSKYLKSHNIHIFQTQMSLGHSDSNSTMRFQLVYRIYPNINMYTRQKLSDPRFDVRGISNYFPIISFSPKLSFLSPNWFFRGILRKSKFSYNLHSTPVPRNPQ